MATHNIYFVNKFSQNQDYAFFSELPKFSPNPTGSPIYSNVFQATTLTKNESWSIKMTDNYYAWCGTADRKLDSGARIELNSAKLVTLAEASAPGSTFLMSSKGGRPTLKSNGGSATNTGSYSIETGSDASFVVGVAATDDEGNTKPLATINAPSHATLNIVPSTKFYIAAQSASVGTTIDATTVSRNAAAIDFAKQTGMYGAVVTHEANGNFSIKYHSQAAFGAAIRAATIMVPAPIAAAKPAITSSTVDPRDAELDRLRQQVKDMQTLLDTALSSGTTTPITAVPVTASLPVPTTSSAPVSSSLKDPYPTVPTLTTYRATLPFASSPGSARRRDIRDRLVTHMATLGYTQEGGSITDAGLTVTFSHDAGVYGNWHSTSKALADWRAAYDALSKNLTGYVADSQNCKVGLVGEETAVEAGLRGLWPAGDGREAKVEEEKLVKRATRVANEENESSRPSSPTAAAHKSLTNGVKETSPRPSSPTVTTHKPMTNGINGLVNGVKHDRTSSKSASPKLTNGVNGISHDKSHTRSSSRPVVNGAVKAVASNMNGIKAPTANGNGVKTSSAPAVKSPAPATRKYDYPRVEETLMEAKKRRAREVLRLEGLSEYATGWQVGRL